jgi:opacity protein-like surface antigen
MNTSGFSAIISLTRFVMHVFTKFVPVFFAAIFSISLASQAQANQQWPRWYVGLSAGVAFVEDTDLSQAKTGELEYGTAGNGAVSLGYVPLAGVPFWDNIRAEVELGYRQAALDSFTNLGTKSGASDDIHMITYLANAYYDFNNPTQWTPYVGAGVGGAAVKLTKTSGLGNTTNSDSVLAYQFMAGFTYAPTSIPMTEWGIGYRYFTANSPSFRTAGANLSLDDITSHNLEATARFRF